MATTTRPDPTAAARREVAPDLRIDLPQGQARRPRLSWIAVGLVLVLAAAVVGAITVARVADRQPVLALATDLDRGSILTAAHLTTVEVATDSDLDLISTDRRDAVIGLVARTDLQAGTLVMSSLLADGPSLPEGWSVVGLALAPGEYPTTELAAGDLVEVIRTPDPVGGTRDDGEPAAVLTGEAEVFAVELLSETTRTVMISLAVPGHVAPEIAAAAAEGRVRLVLVGRR